jgi:hypothetical protein
MFRRERAPDEGESQMSPPTPARRPWTADERKKPDDLLEAGMTVVEIAPLLQRTRQAIYARLQRVALDSPIFGRRGRERNREDGP